jgi:hypothetical protein
VGDGPTVAACDGGAGTEKQNAMPPAVVRTPFVTGTSLINAACQRYREAVKKFKRVEAGWQMLSTQDAVTLISEIQADLRETRQLLDRGASRIPDISGPEFEDASGKRTRAQIAECRQNARDLSDRVDDLLAASDDLIQTCLAHQEAYERNQTAKALAIVLAGALLTVGVALYLLLR